MKALLITKCSDQLMWYAGMVGQVVPYCGQWPEAYKSVEPSGYINRVEFKDAEVIDSSARDKGNKREDIEKARHYLDKWLESNVKVTGLPQPADGSDTNAARCGRSG